MTNPLAVQVPPPPPCLIFGYANFPHGLKILAVLFREYLLCFSKHFLGFHKKYIYQLTIYWHKLRFIAR